jgi:hypothetical protein
MESPRVLLADDLPEILETVTQLLRGDFEIVGYGGPVSSVGPPQSRSKQNWSQWHSKHTAGSTGAIHPAEKY